MNYRLLSVICCVVFGSMLVSCVSNKKFRYAKGTIAGLRMDSAGLARQMNECQSKLRDLEATNRNTNSQLQNTSEQLSQTQDQVEAQRKRLQQLQALIAQQKKNTEALRKKIADALVSFNANELSVSMKNGKVYVSMQEALLFPSGSATVNPKGKEALATLATVLNQSTNINVNVEGHTDSIPISKRYVDNWELSVARSTAIARILIKDYSVQPGRIIASGHSEYDPVATNGTPEGRAMNRRTEIILEPKLDELMDLIRDSQ